MDDGTQINQLKMYFEFFCFVLFLFRYCFVQVKVTYGPQSCLLVAPLNFVMLPAINGPSSFEVVNIIRYIQRDLTLTKKTHENLRGIQKLLQE